jgi:hypothetical protein
LLPGHQVFLKPQLDLPIRFSHKGTLQAPGDLDAMSTKELLHTMVSPIDHVAMNHQNHNEKMALVSMFTTIRSLKMMNY